MGHSFGVLCNECETVLVTDERCPEKGCPGGHGFTFQKPSKWAAEQWPKHACFKGAVDE